MADTSTIPLISIPQTPTIVPSTESGLEIIPIWLRDTYAFIHSEPIYNFQGPLNESDTAEEIAKDFLQTGSNLFISGGDVFTFLSRNNLCDHTITLVIHSLRDLYWSVRNSLPREEVDRLEIALKQPLPHFKNIFEYKKLESKRDSYPSPLYQMFGTLTPFSVLHIPVRHFIQALNAQQPLQVVLNGTEIMIQLDYKLYDFWDPATQSLITHIPC